MGRFLIIRHLITYRQHWSAAYFSQETIQRKGYKGNSYQSCSPDTDTFPNLPLIQENIPFYLFSYKVLYSFVFSKAISSPRHSTKISNSHKAPLRFHGRKAGALYTSTYPSWNKQSYFWVYFNSGGLLHRSGTGRPGFTFFPLR
jgi:hypothetical protein